MEELVYKNIEEIKVDSKLEVSASFKPTMRPIIVVGVVGVALMFINNFLVRILGLVFIVFPILVFTLVKDKKTIDVYETGCVIYNPADNKLAYYLDFNNVEEWDVNHESGHDTIIFTLLDKNRAVVDTFQTNKIYAALDKIIPEKNHIKVLERKNKELNVSPVDAIKNLLNKKK